MNTVENIKMIGNKKFIEQLIEYTMVGYREPMEAAKWIQENTNGEITIEMFTHWINNSSKIIDLTK